MIQRQIGPKTFIADSAPEFSTLISRLFGTVIDGVRGWNRRRMIETELYALSAHLLDDIGVARGDISAIARKWADTEVNRLRDERRIIKAVKAANVASFVPATAAPVNSAVVANDDRQSIAA
ncbi:MAG: DUF1127 domain-containing protein [Rhodospirillales bacterium]|nr:DUF1127 domain-containing protein [Rhodospirillales bacterium]